MTWRRHLGLALGVVAAAWAFYFLLVNWLLLGGLLEQLMSRNPVRTRIAWERAWSLWPGTVEVRGFTLTGQTVRTQYWLRVDRGRLRVSLPELARRHFHATSLEAAGVRYWQRQQRVPGEPLPVAASLEPSIPGLPAERPPLAELAPRQRRFPWRVTLGDVRAAEVEEVWIAAYRGHGNGHLAGDLWFVVGGDVAVPSFTLVFPGLEVAAGAVPVGHDLTVELDGELAPGPSRGQRLLDFVGRLSGQVSVAGEVADFGFLNLVTSGLPRFRLKGAGELAAEVTLERGLPTAASRIRYQSQRISAVLAGIEVSGRGTALIVRREDGRVELAADIRDLGASGRGLATAADAVPHLEVLASSALTDLAHPFADPRLSLNLPRCRIDDLAGLNDILPPGLPLRFQADSTATLAGWITLDQRSGAGAFQLEGEHIEAVVNQQPMAGTVALDLILEDADPDDLIFDIAGSAVRLSSADQRHAAWRAEARFPEAVLGLAAPLQLQGRVAVTMTDTRPLVAAFAPTAPTLLADLMIIDDIKASADFDLTRDQMTLTDLEARGSGVGRALLGGSGATVVLRSAAIDPSQGFRGLHLDLDLADAVIPDLAVLNRYLPPSAGVALAPAHAATLSGHVEVDDQVLSGAVRLEALGVGLELCNRSFAGDLVVELALPAARVDRRHLDLSGSRLWLGQMVAVDGLGTRRQPWSVRVDVVRGDLDLADGPVVAATLDAWLDTTGPLVAAYLPERGAGMRLEDLLNVDGVALSADLVATSRSLSLDHLALSGQGTVAGHLRGPGFELVATELALDSELGFTRVDLTVTLPRSEVVDLTAFNRYLPAAAGARFVGDSQGAVSGELRVVDGVAWGQARVEADGVALELGPLAVVGDLAARVNLRRVDLERQRFDLGGSSLSVDAARVGNGARKDAWWARLDLPSATLDLAADTLAARLYFEMGDSRPLVGLVTSPRQAWLADLVTFSEVTGMAAVQLAGDAVHLDELEVRGFGSGDTGIFGPGLTVTMSASDVDLTTRGEGLVVTVDLPPSPVHDLSRFNRYLPASSGLTLLPGGKGEVSARLELASGRASGHFRLTGHDVGATVMGADARGDLALDVPIRSGDLAAAELDVSGTTLRLSGLRLDDGRGHLTDGWWADLSLPEARVHMDYPVGFTGSAELALRDSWPVAVVAAAHGFWGRALRPLLVVDDIVGRAEVGLDRSGLVLDSLELSGDRLAAEGRLRFERDGASGLLLLSWRGLDGAIHLDRGRQRFKLFRPRRWYERMVAAADVSASAAAAEARP